MIDQFALALPHLLLAIATWRLLLRDELDAERQEEAGEPPVNPPVRGRRRGS